MTAEETDAETARRRAEIRARCLRDTEAARRGTLFPGGIDREGARPRQDGDVERK